MKKITCAVDETRELAPDETRAILDQDKKGEFLLLDVRQPEEYEAGHIPGAILIPLDELEARQKELDRSKKIIAYCRSGRRSMAAAIALCRLGFKDVYHVNGGILNWPYKTISGMPAERPDLITEATDIKDILMLGIKLEKGSWDFYMSAQSRTELPQVRRTFQTLAKAEDGHIKRLYERAMTLLGPGAFAPLEELKRQLKVEHMEGGIEISPALAKVTERFIDEMEALEIALEKEYMSYDFYERTSISLVNPDAKMLLHELALEERKHADTLLKHVAEIARQGRLERRPR